MNSDDIKNISIGEAKQQISDYLAEYFKPGEKFYPHQIAKALNMSVFDVHHVLKELEKDEEIGWE